ncbi:MAG TPA: ABC transporter ATP-binding protein [Planctomycetota bacterium]|nr:ABC transporter ATP-binding protein [Planctomycetota bacterium]
MAKEKTEKKKKITLSAAWRETRELMAAHKGRLALGMAVMIVNRISGLVLPTLSKFLIDDVIDKHRSDLLWTLALIGGGATVVQAISSFSLSQILGIAAQRAINDLRNVVQAHVTRLPVRYFDSTTSGALVSRIMSDAEGVRNLIGTGIVQLIGGIVTAAFGLAVLFFLNWSLTLMIVVILAVFGICMSRAFMFLRPLFRERSKINAEVTGRLTETLGGIRNVKAYVAEEREQRVFGEGTDRIFQNVKRTMTGISANMAVTTVIVGAIGMLMIVVGGRAILADTMTKGDFVMYLVYVGLVTAPIVQIASIGTQISEAFAGLDRIRELRRMDAEDAGDAQRKACPDSRGDVRFDDVVFEYNPGRPVLKNISLHAPAGSTTALVGSSGSGKSTLVSLVMAFNRPLSGVVSVDGQNLADLRLRDYRSHLGVVLQDNFLFDGSIAENIRFSRPDASMDEVRAAGTLAHCEEFISGFEKGYDTIVGERGVKLSGGQRQRVAIARALLAQPRILILDEATSSLDSESEAMIQDGLKALRRGRTTFVIAHRLSTIRSADQILVLEAGEIVERGTHDELLARGGRYRTLYDKQYRFEHERFVNRGEEHKGLERPEIVSVG